MKKKFLRPRTILALMHEDLVPPATTAGLTPEQIQPWKMEYDVVATLEQMGHQVCPVGLYGDLDVLRRALERVQPDIVFNLLEEFDGQPLFDQHLVSYLELMQVPYTGCNPRGLTLAHDKALTKRILAHHGIAVPKFAVYRPGDKVSERPGLEYPLLVKSLVDEGSVGISRASVVSNARALARQVSIMQRRLGRPVIAEQYIAGREIYLSLIGNERLRAFTPWELIMSHLPPGVPNIATSRLKWNYAHQQEVGLDTLPAHLPTRLERQVVKLSKQVYRALSLSGYARLDFRLGGDGRFYLLEANPNPDLAYGEDFAESVERSGMDYATLLDTILRQGLNYRRRF